MEKIELRIKIGSCGLAPEKATDGSACYDIFSAYDVTIEPGETKLVKSDIFLQPPEGYFTKAHIRSGLALKHSLTLVNGTGIIDNDYRGDVGFIIHNLSNEDPYQIWRGNKIGQLEIVKEVPCSIILVDEVNDTERGAGGFGSSGK